MIGMNGIDILSSRQEVTLCLSWMIISLLVIVFALILTVILMIWKTDYFGIGLVILIIAAISWLLSVVITLPTGRTVYKVTISDEISYEEFTTKYEVISQEGRIYEIVEK